MRVLVTGANGYIGQRLLLTLLREGHHVYAMIRHPSRLDKEKFFNEVENKQLEIVVGDFLNEETLNDLPEDIDVAFYLLHSMSGETSRDFEDLEAKTAHNFVKALGETKLKQVIYLSGIANSEDLSKHLRSRVNVENILLQCESFQTTVLRAAIIIGSGSSSFEIIRDLVEKLPLMIAPKWLDTKCQPIAVRNVIQYLLGIMLNSNAYNKVFDIGGPDVLTYKDMLVGYAQVRKLKRYILSLPWLSPEISVYWLSLITSTNFALAKNLVGSLKNEVVVKNQDIKQVVPIDCYGYRESVQRALYRIEQGRVFSSWKDAFIHLQSDRFIGIEVPEYGCLTDKQYFEFERDIEEVKKNVWSIGGDRGWYHMDWAWEIRGFLDTLFGGVGLRRGRRDSGHLRQGDALDFWRVLKANKKEGHLILYAEMKLPGEAWLEFKVKKGENGKNIFRQIATFRPHGLWGRLYWYLLLPAHFFIFATMAKSIINYSNRK